jgi:hypothetical protein
LCEDRYYFLELADRQSNPRLRAEVNETFRQCSQPSTAPSRALLYKLGARVLSERSTRQRVARGWRNFALALGSALTIIVSALWASGVSSGEVVGLGAAAGLLSLAVSQRPDAKSQTPYNLAGAQLLLKVSAGATTAVLAVKLFAASGLGAIAPAGKNPDFYAIVFGFSQQAFTRVIDQKATAAVEDSSNEERLHSGTASEPESV